MSRINIPDPDDMNEQRSLWAEVALRQFVVEVSGPQALVDTNNLDDVAIDFLCDLAHLADLRGWKLVKLLRWHGLATISKPRVVESSSMDSSSWYPLHTQ